MIEMNKAILSIVMAFLLVALVGCGKEKDLDTGDLPDLTKQTRPFVTVEQTKVHTGPGIQFKTIATIPKGAKVDIVGKHDDWLLVTSKRGNAPGYVEAAAVRPTNNNHDKWEPARSQVTGPYKLLTNTEVREGPGLHYRTVAKVPKGIKINVTGEEEGWLRVESRHGKPPGYVDRNLAEPFSDR